VNHAVLRLLHPEQVEVEICRSEELDQRRGLIFELDKRRSFVRRKANPRWLWHAIDHRSGKVLAYMFGRRRDEVFLELKKRLGPFGITRYYTEGWGAYERHLEPEYRSHTVKNSCGLTLIVFESPAKPFLTLERMPMILY
jgi:insertion element IS1 protein InsB